MITRHDLEQLNRRIDRLSAELEEVRRHARRLEQAAGLPETAMPSTGVELRLPVVEPTVEPLPVVESVEAQPAPVSSVPDPLPEVVEPMVAAVEAPLPEAPRPVALPPVLDGPVPTLPRVPVPPAVHRTGAEPAGVDEWAKVREWLQRMQLWPPAGESSMEVRLGAWWATRIGILCAVIGAVFFGVYVSQFTPAWVKVLEMLGVAAGLGGLGLWLERREPRFGSVLVGGALALVYFTAFGAYAVPALHVLDTPAAGVAWQLIAAAGVLGAAWWRKDQAVAVMAVALGYVTTAFSLHHGLPGWVLPAATGLALAAVALRMRRGWEAPSVVALPCAWGLLAWTGWHWPSLMVHPIAVEGPGMTPWPWSLWGWAVGLGALFWVRDWPRLGRDGATRAEPGVRGFAGVNMSLALLVAGVLTWSLAPTHLAAFYFGATCLVGAATVAWKRRVPDDPLVVVWMAKTSALLALGLIAWSGAATRWIILLVQATATLWAAQRLRERALWWLAGAVALTSAEFFGADIFHSAVWVPFSGLGLLSAGYVLAWAAWLGWEESAAPSPDARYKASWIGGVVGGCLLGGLAYAAAPGGWAPIAGLAMVGALIEGSRRARVRGLLVMAVLGWTTWAIATAAGAMAHVQPWHVTGWVAVLYLVGSSLLVTRLGPVDREARQGMALILGLLAIVTWWVAPWWHNASMPLFAVGVGILLALAARRVRSLAPLGAAVGSLIAAEVWLVVEASTRGTALWLDVGAALLATGFVVVALEKFRATIAASRWPGITWAAMAPAIVVLGVALVRDLTLAGALLGGGLGALVLVVGGRWLRRWPMGWMATILVGITLSALVVHFGEAGALGFAALLAVWAPLICDEAMARFGGGLAFSDSAGAAGVEILDKANRVLLLVAGTIVLEWVVASGSDDPSVIMWRLLVAGLALGVIAIWPGVAGAWTVATVECVAWMLVAIFGAAYQGVVAAAALGGVAWLLMPVVARRVFGDPQPRWRRTAVWLHGIGVLGVWLLTCRAERTGMDEYATVGWGMGAVVAFLIGLFGRERVYRMLALGVAGLAVARLFIVDLDSTLYRIVGFVAVGLVLLWVGFSYHKFRHLIVEDDEAARDGSAQPAADQAAGGT